MLIDKFRLGGIYAAISILLGVAAVSAQAPIQVGMGPDSSYLIIEASLFGSVLSYQYNYTYNPGTPLNTYDMLTAIDAAEASLSFTYINYGTIDDPNYFVDAVTYNAQTVTNTPFPAFSPYWAQWVSGGLSGYPAGVPVDYGVWSYGSGISAPYRELAPNTTDAFVYGDSDLPSVSPIPEAKIWALLTFGLLALGTGYKRWLKKRHAGV